MLRWGEIVFFRADHTNWLSNQIDNPENIHTSNMIQIEQAIHKNIYVHTFTYVYIKTINENIGHEFEVKERYILAREEKREGEMMLV